MAAAFDKSLGTGVNSNLGATSSPFAFTTNASSLVTARIVVVIATWIGSGASFNSVTIGGSAATRDAINTNTGGDTLLVYSVPKTAVMASGASISIAFTPGAGIGGTNIGVLSITGVDMTVGGGVAGTGSASSSSSSTSWLSGTASATGGIGVGGATNEVTASSIGGSMTSGTKIHDMYDATSGQGMQSAYIVGGTSLAGTFASASTSTAGAIVTYSPLVVVDNTTKPGMLGEYDVELRGSISDF